MITLGFGYSVLDTKTGTSECKFYTFSVPSITPEQFEDLEQNFDHPDCEEWDDVFGAAAVVATIDCCDVFTTEKTPTNTYLWADYNVTVPEREIIHGCEILRNFFVEKGVDCSLITEYVEN